MDSDELLKDLEKYGADTKRTMERFMDDVELYRDCLQMFAGDENFSLLGQALADEDYKKAFTAAHSLKGVAANLGLTPLLTAICAIVEPLRGGKSEGLPALYEEVLLQLEKFVKAASLKPPCQG